MGATRAIVTHRWPCGATTYINTHTEATEFIGKMVELLRPSQMASPKLQEKIDVVSAQLTVEEHFGAPLRSIVSDLRWLNQASNNAKHEYEQGKVQRAIANAGDHKDAKQLSFPDGMSATTDVRDAGSNDNAPSASSAEPPDYYIGETLADCGCQTDELVGLQAKIQDIENKHESADARAYIQDLERAVRRLGAALDECSADAQPGDYEPAGERNGERARCDGTRQLTLTADNEVKEHPEDKEQPEDNDKDKKATETSFDEMRIEKMDNEEKGKILDALRATLASWVDVQMTVVQGIAKDSKTD